ncbi:Crp/Fnr family transcriptional regulator [Putridiphycobacter roseus]|uniref:Crp/Fnr family transcriptional regulator n=1 Tax=Putridiphycobacter roseus TaxID=2219161 RepID=A0A2W1NK31_9FLAO|nr:Crp/Fnr family transcriptional regulator [Putridiphycobacter roseus]PZE16012.1 Crp/Fnr family transcriptional regulator [Putridiphycobacter roseus]
MQALIDKIKSQIQLSPKAEAYLFSIGKVKEYPKGTILIRQGQAVNKTFYVTGGCLRSFCVDKNGKEHTLQFAIENWWISDYIAIHNHELATLTVACITDSKLIEFDAKALNHILTLFPEYEPFQRYILERHLVSLHKRILNQLQLTATERYDLFLKQYPNIEQSTRNYYIASYLGITQESLSRIRAKKA